jgi:O-acetyl-ADP-ribose deacetylase (regulator of RNase III)
MKVFAHCVCRTFLLGVAISAGVFGQPPNSHPTTAPSPRKKAIAQAGNVQKVTRKTKAGKALEKAAKEEEKRAKKAKKRSA